LKLLPVKIYRLKNALIFPVNAPSSWDRPSIVGVQSLYVKNDPKEFGLMYFKKYLVNYRLRKEYLAKYNPVKLPGNYLYLGPLQSHFGHFMEESLGRLWACDLYKNRVDGFIFIKYHEGIKVHPYMVEVFNLFKVDSQKLKLVNQLYEVENLIIPEIGAWLGSEKKWFKRVTSNFINVEDYKRKLLPKKIIVRRSSKFLGRVAGFNYFSNILVGNGFQEIYPERYSIREQIEFVVSANIIIWEQGSACHLLKILPNLKSTSILIRRDPYQPAIENLLATKFKHLIIFKDVITVFKIDSWFAHKSRSNLIMSTFKSPEGTLNFFKRNNLINDYKFENSIFRKAEKKDLLYFYIYYFLFIHIQFFVINYIKPILPKFVWLKLKVMRDYFFGQR